MAQRDIGNLRTRLSWDDNGAKRGITGLRDDLKGLRSEMNVVKSAGRQYSNSLKGLRQQSDILNRTYKTQQQRVRELYKRYRESARVKSEDAEQTQNLKRQYNNATAQMQRTERQLEQVTDAIKEQTNPWRRLSRNMDTAGRRMQTVGRGMASTGRTMTMRVTTPLLGMAGAAIKVASDFEEGMSEVQAKSGATASDMEKLEEQAKEMGETTRFSATEASQGYTFLAQAGYDTQEMLQTMPGLLDLAASANMDLGNAADIASNILTAFNLEASETNRVSDVLAKGASSANTSVEQLGGAFQYVAPVASTLGISIEETAAAIGVFSDSGIQGQQAGRMLRQGMLRLSNPTGEAADLIKELGINVFDAEGNMKSMPDVVKELNSGLEGMESDARAAALATIFGSESTAGWSALLDNGADDLADYTGELKNAEGAASDMAATMEDNAKGSMREFKSAMEGAGVEASEHLLPVFTDMVDGATELIRKFGDLDESTQKNIIKMAGFAAALGPTALVAGNLTTAIGGITRAGSGLVGMLGKKGGSGLLGRIAGLSRGGVVGLAIGGVGALAYGIHKLTSNSEEAEDVNLDLAKSFSDQAAELDNSVDTFNELSNKAKISNSQLAEMNDLNKRISESSNPGEIKVLKDRYQELAKESGLSKDEIEELFKANDNIIEQSPDVEKSISNQGNEFAESTDKVQEYIDKLREQSELEIRAERQKLLEQEQDTIDTINQKKEEQEMIDQRIKGVLDATNMTNAEITDRVEEINEKFSEGVETDREAYKLDAERNDLLEIKRGKTDEILDSLMNEKEQIQNSIDKEEQKLEKLDATNELFANILLQNVGINEQGEEGLEQLDKTIAKNQEEIKKLEEKREANGELSEEEQTRLETLQDTVEEHENAKIKIFEETELYNDLNSLAQLKLDKLDEEGQKRIENLAKTRDIKVEEGNIVDQMRTKNDELLEERDNLIQNLQKNGENSDEIREQISEIDTKIIKNDTVLQKILKELGIWEDVKDEINSGADGIDGQNSNLSDSERKLLGLIGDAEDYTDELRKDVNKTVDTNLNPSAASINSALGQTVEKQIRANVQGNVFAQYGLGYASGTDYHPGGTSWLGEEGAELVKHRDKWALADFGLYNVPRGAQVFTHDESKRIINALNNMPGYASGVSPSGEADRIVGQLNQQPQQMQGEAVIYTTVVNQMDGRELSRHTYRHVTELQQRSQGRKRRYA